MLRQASRRPQNGSFAFMMISILLAVIVPVAFLIMPLVAAVGALFLISLTTGLLHPKFFVAVSAVALLFVRTLEYRSGSSAVGYLDEFCVFVCALAFPLKRVLARRSFVAFPAQRYFLAFLAFGVMSALVRDVPAPVLASGLLLAGKGILFAWALAQVDWSADDLPRIAKCAGVIMAFILLCAFVNLLAPGFWMRGVLGLPGFGYRYGIPPIVGPFVHPGYFGTTVALFCVAAIAYRTYVGRSRWNTLLIGSSLVVVVLTVRRKVVAALLLCIAYLYVRRRGKGALLVIAALIPVTLVLVWPVLFAVLDSTAAEYLSNPDEVARIRLYVDGVGLAGSAFPLGVGFGRFGSATARAYYSPEYEQLGYRSIWGLGDTEETGKFLTDTFWPAVFAEAGILGGVALLLGLIFTFRTYSLFSRTTADPRLKWIFVVACIWTIEMTVESLAGAVFTAAPTYGLYFGLLGIAASLVHNCGRKVARPSTAVTASGPHV